MNIYVTGIKYKGDEASKLEFEKIQSNLESLGYKVSMPWSNVECEDESKSIFINRHILLNALCNEAVYLVKGWQNCKASCKIRAFAEMTGIKIIYES